MWGFRKLQRLGNVQSWPFISCGCFIVFLGVLWAVTLKRGLAKLLAQGSGISVVLPVPSGLCGPQGSEDMQARASLVAQPLPSHLSAQAQAGRAAPPLGCVPPRGVSTPVLRVTPAQFFCWALPRVLHCWHLLFSLSTEMPASLDRQGLAVSPESCLSTEIQMLRTWHGPRGLWCQSDAAPVGSASTQSSNVLRGAGTRGQFLPRKRWYGWGAQRPPGRWGLMAPLPWVGRRDLGRRCTKGVGGVT